MATYLERRLLIEDAEFAKRIQVALWVLATNVLANVGSTPAEKQWANKTLRGDPGQDVIRKVAIRLSANAQIGAVGSSATDPQIQTVIDGMLAELAA